MVRRKRRTRIAQPPSGFVHACRLCVCVEFLCADVIRKSLVVLIRFMAGDQEGEFEDDLRSECRPIDAGDSTEKVKPIEFVFADNNLIVFVLIDCASHAQQQLGEIRPSTTK